jgi:hypothetical protein
MLKNSSVKKNSIYLLIITTDFALLAKLVKF